MRPTPDPSSPPSRPPILTIRRMSDLGIGFKDLSTRETSLEEIFVNLVRAPRGDAPARENAAGEGAGGEQATAATGGRDTATEDAR